MPPFQEIVDHARKKNLILLHQNNQIQNINTTTCGYFCLYFLNEMSKGRSYYDLLKVFNIHNTMKNEKYIKNSFKNIYSYYIMVKSYCMKQKKQTESVPGSEKLVKTKNNRLMLKSICSECGIKKSKFIAKKDLN